MARTITEIAASIEAEKNTRTELAALNSPSAVAIWKLIKDTIAFMIWILETLFDKHKTEVLTAISRNYYGTAPWYVEVVKKFQLGDALELSDRIPQYPAGSIGAKIITRATAKTSAEGWIYLKVAKDGATAGDLAPLDPAELVQAKGYLNQLQPAGARVEMVSREADRLKLTANIYYDPLLPVATVRDAVIEAVAIGYLKALDFDGMVFRSKLEDGIQEVAGVADVEILAVTARSGAISNSVGRIYETQAGYIIQEDNVGETFMDTLNFIPNYIPNYVA
jgi:hypothetical protein